MHATTNLCLPYYSLQTVNWKAIHATEGKLYQNALHIYHIYYNNVLRNIVVKLKAQDEKQYLTHHQELSKINNQTC